MQTGEVLSRLTGDTTLVQTVVGSSISMDLRSLFQFTGAMIMLAVTSFYLFSLNLGLRRFADRVETSFVTAIRRTRVRAALTALIIVAVMGTIIFVLWVGANQVREGSMTGGQLASFVLYAALVAGGVGTMSEVWGDVMRAAGATERLLELLRTQPAITETFATQSLHKPMQVAVRLEDVDFYYPARSETAALQDINLDIAPGESVALVGPPGAGKTTLFQLLLRFYDVTGGRIRLNGRTYANCRCTICAA